MKKVMKRVITACLAFAMILALVTPASVEAATKNESLTLYKGETYTWYLTGVKSLSSASSTKKAVATVKANKSKKQYTISAKKAGTSVVTIKGKDYYGHTQSLKIKVTVAEPKFDLKLQKLDGNYILISLKNNTKATFDRIAVKYSLKDSSGSELAAKEEKVYRVMSGKTAYERIYVASAADVDISQSSVKITGFDRNPDQKYKVLGKDKLSVTVTDEQASDTRITFKLKEVNKTSQYVYGEVYILSYDASGNMDQFIWIRKKQKQHRNFMFQKVLIQILIITRSYIVDIIQQNNCQPVRAESLRFRSFFVRKCCLKEKWINFQKNS